MTTLSELPQVTSMADSDTFVINVGGKQRTLPKSSLSIESSNGYSIEQVTATSNYTLASSTANEVWVFIDGNSYDLTLPNDSSIATGTKYIVFNTATSAITINIASGATCTNISDGTSNVISNATNEGYARGEFYKTGASTWVAAGDIGLPA